MSAFFAVIAILLPHIFYGFPAFHTTRLPDFRDCTFTRLTDSRQCNLATKRALGWVNALHCPLLNYVTATFPKFYSIFILFTKTHVSESDILTL